MPHQLPGGAVGLRDFAARVETAGIERIVTGAHVTFKGGQGFDGLVNATAIAVACRWLVCCGCQLQLVAATRGIPMAQVVTGRLG